MKQLVMTLSVLFALSAFAVPKALDIRPTATAADAPATSVWQQELRINLDALTAPAVLKQYLANDRNCQFLLAQVKPAAQTSDPYALTQIAAVTQYVMTPGNDAKLRTRWTQNLMKMALKYQNDPYQAAFYIDQLRWCGTRAQIADLTRLSTKANLKSTREAAAIAIGEINHTQKK